MARGKGLTPFVDWCSIKIVIKIFKINRVDFAYTNLQYNVVWQFITEGKLELSLLKVILEQRNPFTDSFTTYDRAKLQLGMFLLAGIVVSNAYKNSNVYNMILPRSPFRMNFLRN